MRRSCDKTKNLCNRFNDYVRGEMKRKKIRQAELADYIHIGQQALSRKLSGENTWELSQALDAIEFLNGDISEVFR